MIFYFLFTLNQSSYPSKLRSRKKDLAHFPVGIGCLEFFDQIKDIVFGATLQLIINKKDSFLFPRASAATQLQAYLTYYKKNKLKIEEGEKQYFLCDERSRTLF